MRNVITTEKIFTCNFEPRRWIVNKILSSGLSLLIGKEKIGKSILSIYLSVRKKYRIRFFRI